MPFKFFRKAILSASLPGHLPDERIILKDLPVTEKEFKDAPFHLKTFGKQEASFAEIFEHLQHVRDDGYGTPKLFGHGELPGFNDFPILPRHLVLLAIGLKNRLESDQKINVAAAPFYKRPAMKAAFFQFRMGLEELLADMRDIHANYKLRSQVRDELLGYSGYIEPESGEPVVYANDRPERPDLLADEVELAIPEDFIDVHLGHRPRNMNRILTEQQRHWILDAEHTKLPAFQGKIESLLVDLTRHVNGLSHASESVSKYDTRYAKSLKKELREHLEKTRVVHEKVTRILKEIARIRSDPHHEPKLP